MFVVQLCIIHFFTGKYHETPAPCGRDEGYLVPKCAKAFFRTVSVQEHNTLSFMDITAKGDILAHQTAFSEGYNARIQLIN
jgi:hypothetical protein